MQPERTPNQQWRTYAPPGSRAGRRQGFRVGLGLCFSMGLFVAGFGQDADVGSFARHDPAKIVTTEFTKTPCRECHASEYEVWRLTPHATGFKELHRKESAEEIAGRMGFKLIKRDSLCLSCHYTSVEKSGVLRAVSGVSCESCHGPGRDWVNVHNDYGGKGFDHTNETAEHKAARIQQSRDAGMLRPSDIYPVVASCYQCHLVNNEKLVNVGGHNTGSRGFEYVEWSQGQIRHNFLQSYLTGDGRENAERSIEHKRVMYVVGAAAGLEYALRGVAEAKEKGRFFSAMLRSVKDAKKQMGRIARLLPMEELGGMLKASKVDLKLGNAEALLAAADEIAKLNQGFLDKYGGADLQPVDALLLGTPLAEADEEEPGEESEGPGADQVAEAEHTAPVQQNETPRTDPGPTAPSGETRKAPVRAATQHKAVGTRKTRIRPLSSFKTVGPSKCVSCHDEADAWWIGDPHGLSVDPFFDQRPKNVKIARLYGLTPSSMLRGNQVCMDCHGSVISGKEKREVNDGVGCESCHGPGDSYLDPHQEGEKELGLKRPGYLKALTLGMNELKNPAARAKACVSCHYITDSRLISSGHPTGEGFDYLGGLTKIKHWQGAVHEPGPWRQAVHALLATRGPVPDVAPPPASQAGSGSVGNTPSGGIEPPASSDSGSSTSARPPSSGSQSQASRPSSGRPASDSSSTAASTQNTDPLPPSSLPGFPEITEDTSVEDILLLLKQRLELLHGRVRELEKGEKP